MTGSGQTYFEVSAAELHELRWRAYLAGYDQRNQELAGAPTPPLNEQFARWRQHEAERNLDALEELTR